MHFIPALPIVYMQFAEMYTASSCKMEFIPKHMIIIHGSVLPYYDSVDRIVRSSAVKAHRHQQRVTMGIFTNVVLMLLNGKHCKLK